MGEVEAKNGPRQNGTQGEDSDESIAENGTGEQEVKRLAVIREQSANVVNKLLVGTDQTEALDARFGRDFGHYREHRDREDERPQSGDQKDDADVERGVARDAEPVAVAEGKTKERDE